MFIICFLVLEEHLTILLNSFLLTLVYILLTKWSILEQIWVCAQKEFVVLMNETGTIEGSNFA